MSEIPGYGRPGEDLRRDEQGRVRDEQGRVVYADGSRVYPPLDGWYPPEQTAARNSEPSLWEQAVQLLKDLVLSFGHPTDLVLWGFIRRLYHRALGHEICELEHLVRRAIRADADDIDTSTLKLASTRSRPRKPRAPAEKTPHDPHNPPSWKVSFRMIPRAPRIGPRSSCVDEPRAGKPRTEPRTQRNVIPYAYRMEALRRVIKHRADYTVRFARRQARRAARAVEEKLRVIEALRAALQSDYDIPVNTELSITPRNAKHEEPG